MGSKLLKNLTENEKSNFLNSFEKKSFKQNDIIKQENKTTKEAFFLKSGEVVVKKSGTDGETEIVTLKPDDGIFFSLSCMIDGKKSLTTIVAKSDVEILSISKEAFFGFCKKNPSVGVKILENITEMLVGFLRKSDENLNQMYKTLEEVL